MLPVHCKGGPSQGNTSASTNLSVALTVSINLGGQELLCFLLLRAVTHPDSQGSGVLPQVTHRSFLPAAQMQHEGVMYCTRLGFRPFLFFFYSNNSANKEHSVGGEREEVKMKHERRDDHKLDIV